MIIITTTTSIISSISITITTLLLLGLRGPAPDARAERAQGGSEGAPPQGAGEGSTKCYY